MLPEKISFRPGNLAGPMAERIQKTQETPSEYLRRVVAFDLGVEPPAMNGNLATLRQFSPKKKKAGGARNAASEAERPHSNAGEVDPTSHST